MTLSAGDGSNNSKDAQRDPEEQVAAKDLNKKTGKGFGKAASSAQLAC